MPSVRCRSCSSEFHIKPSQLAKGRGLHCSQACRKRAKDEAGRRYGRLTVIRREPRAHKAAFWLCRCDCGATKVVDGRHLRRKRQPIRSCGCLARELVGDRFRTHGKSATGEFAVWSGMKSRCMNPNAPGYGGYGGRGVRVCERWASSFEAFLADMGPRPSSEHTLDRIDNDGNYEPGNCRWATPIEQANNKRTNRVLTARGRSQTMAEWSRETGVPQLLIANRLKRGWPTERAVFEPVNARRRARGA